MNGDNDVVTMTCQCFIDGVIHHLEHHVVQAAAVVCVADVHTGTLAHGFKTFEHLDG